MDTGTSVVGYSICLIQLTVGDETTGYRQLLLLKWPILTEQRVAAIHFKAKKNEKGGEITIKTACRWLLYLLQDWMKPWRLVVHKTYKHAAHSQCSEHWELRLHPPLPLSLNVHRLLLSLHNLLLPQEMGHNIWVCAWHARLTLLTPWHIVLWCDATHTYLQYLLCGYLIFTVGMCSHNSSLLPRMSHNPPCAHTMYLSVHDCLCSIGVAWKYS